MKAYKKLTSAMEYAKSIGASDIIRVGGSQGLYIVIEAGEWPELCLINADNSHDDGGHSRKGVIAGHVSLHHLRRLGNANWAKAHPKLGNDPASR